MKAEVRTTSYSSPYLSSNDTYPTLSFILSSSGRLLFIFPRVSCCYCGTNNKNNYLAIHLGYPLSALATLRNAWPSLPFLPPVLTAPPFDDRNPSTNLTINSIPLFPTTFAEAALVACTLDLTVRVSIQLSKHNL